MFFKRIKRSFHSNSNNGKLDGNGRLKVMPFFFQENHIFPVKIQVWWAKPKIFWRRRRRRRRSSSRRRRPSCWHIFTLSVSNTFNNGRCKSTDCTKETSACVCSMRVPFSKTSPMYGLNCPARVSSSVVLPAPIPKRTEMMKLVFKWCVRNKWKYMYQE